MATPTREAVCRLCRDFKDWVQQNVEEGIDGTGREANYVSTTKLKTFWSHSRIATIVGLHDEDVNIDTILSSFIQTVSILAYIADDSHSWTEYLVSFYRSETDDHSLPLRTPDPDTNWTLAAHLRRDPKPFRDDPDGCAAWLQFSAHQWKFLPLQLKSSKGIIDRVHRPRTVDPRHIIPITVESELSPRSGRRAKVVKVRPHEASGLPEEPIVFKEYDASRDIDEFMDERSTYNTIENLNRASKYILGYYGCFIQGNKCVLLIEYANQGNLLEFFKGNRFLPRTEKEAQDLWSDLAHLIDGIALLHNGGKHNSSIHHAIKPSNIFVSQVESKPDRFSFKFGNFETSIAIPITESGEATGLDGGGTLMYSAPELCRIYPEVHMEGLVTCQADIWSFGCVLLESGVWMALHERGRIEFRQERVEETLPLIGNSLGKASYAGAFHDGERVLSTVQNKVSKIWALGTPVARLTARMMDFIEREVLRADVGERLTAQQLQAHFREALDESLHLSSPIMPELPSQVVQSRISPRRTPSLFSYQTAVSGGVIAKDWPPRQPAPWTVESTAARRDSFASLTSFQTTLSTRRSIVSSQEVSSSSSIQPRASESVQQLSNRINSTDRVVISSLQEVPATAFDGDPSRTVPSVLAWIPERKREGTPVLEWLEQPLKQVEGRDHYFVFDNSRTMHEHWDDVTRAAEALMYVLKGADTDGFEIQMTNSAKPTTRKHWGSAFCHNGYFDQHRPTNHMGPCPMEDVLSSILSRAIKKALAPTSMLARARSRGASIYVFTNGVWEGRQEGNGSYDEAGGVDNAIKTAVVNLKAAGYMRTFLSIQFIRFGDDPTGRRRMEWLGNDLRAKTGWDIVGTSAHTGSVKKMIVSTFSFLPDELFHNIVDRHQKMSPDTSPMGKPNSSESLSSLSTRHNDFIGFVAKDLFTTVQDYDKQTLENIAKLLPDLLKEFVLSLGSGGEDALHRTLLSLVRTHYKAILSSFEALLLGKGILLAAKKNINDEITNYYADSMTSSTPLPRRGDDDAQAVATNCDNDEGDADENNYRHFLMNTPAYQWLISEIGKEGRLLRADHDIMEDVKAIVLQCLPSPSDGAPLQRHKGTFELQWDPLLFFKEQRFKGNLTDVFGGAITITGSGSDAQALTVRDYLSQTWPTTCESILQLVANTIHNTTNYAASIELLDGTCVESVIYNGSFIVDVMGTRQSLVDIAQQIVWLGAALRSSDFEDGVASCTPIILNELKASTISTTPEIRALPPRDIFFKVQFAMVKLVDETIPGKCWHRMFKNPVMVNGYPILARNERELGLEIPLGIMGALVASKQVEVFEGMLFIKGFSAMLVSTKVISNNLNHHTVIWHYIFNPEGKKISYLEHNIGKDHDFTLEDLKNARHIVGWCANTTYHAGSGDARYDITESGLPPPHSGCILERVTISVGKGITGGGSFALGIKDVPIHVNSDGYIPSISSMSENYVVLWDENEKRGWLVNAASALLHIVMTALRYYSTTTLARQLLFKMEEMINPKDFNAESALEILTDATNRQLKIFLDRCESFEESVDQMEPEARRKVNFYLFEDLVEDRCRMLDQIMAHHENLAGRNGINLKPRVRKHLEGWDFADLAKGRKVYPHVATLNALGYGWVDFVRTIGAIPLFGRGFGDIIRPANPDIMCPNWASLPMEKYYLATTLFDMENIMARFGNRWSNPKKAVHGLDLYCPGQTLALRQCCALQGIRHHDPVHVFYPERYSRVLGSQSTEWSNLDSTSALVFGHNLVWRYRWRDKGEEELEECKPSPEFSCCQLGGSLNPVTVLASRNTALSIQAELATVPPSRLFTSSSITTKQRPNPDRAQEQNPHVISNADSARSRRQEMRISQGVGRS